MIYKWINTYFGGNDILQKQLVQNCLNSHAHITLLRFLVEIFYGKTQQNECP